MSTLSPADGQSTRPFLAALDRDGALLRLADPVALYRAGVSFSLIQSM
jgi:hypothetical protein